MTDIHRPPPATAGRQPSRVGCGSLQESCGIVRYGFDGHPCIDQYGLPVAATLRTHCRSFTRGAVIGRGVADALGSRGPRRADGGGPLREGSGMWAVFHSKAGIYPPCWMKMPEQTAASGVDTMLQAEFGVSFVPGILVQALSVHTVEAMHAELRKAMFRNSTLIRGCHLGAVVNTHSIERDLEGPLSSINCLTRA
eukprot:6163471-Amphidinium_carterae.1